MKKREIHAIDYTIVQVVAFLDRILFDPILLGLALREETPAPVKEVLETLKQRLGPPRKYDWEWENIRREILDSIDVEVVREGADVVARAYPLGWPKNSAVGLKLSVGILQRWEINEAALYIPGIFNGMRLVGDSFLFLKPDGCCDSENRAFLILLKCNGAMYSRAAV
jgi:hypothetical protein